jgi:hypothetical protein
VASAPDGSPILRISRMEWVPLAAGGSSAARGGVGPLTPAEEEEEAVYLRLLRQVSETRSFYFSPAYNLTRSLQRNDADAAAAAGSGASGSPSSASSSSSSGAAAAGLAAPSSSTSASSSVPAAAAGSTDAAASFAEEPFWWNRAASACIAEATGGADFLTPIMNGFVGSADVLVAGPTRAVTILLVTRRSFLRQGTRLHMRGADADGNTANYAETEQIVLLGSGGAASHVQIRGSIPVVWAQPPTVKYTPRCVIADREASNLTAFQRHADVQLARYGKVAAVCLIDKKGDQKRLGDTFERVSARLDPARWSFTWFDFHARCKKSYAAVADLVTSLRPFLDESRFYLKDDRGTVLSTQAGVVRTNCVDNLDRTNVVQSFFARAAYAAMVPGGASAAAGGLSSASEFDFKYNNLWADNADAISLLYAGTGALKTEHTRTGKKSIWGDLRDGHASVTRYVLNNFVDGRTQDAWDLFLGNYVPERSASAAKTGAGALSPIRAHMAEITPVRRWRRDGEGAIAAARGEVNKHSLPPLSPFPLSFICRTASSSVCCCSLWALRPASPRCLSGRARTTPRRPASPTVRRGPSSSSAARPSSSLARARAAGSSRDSCPSRTSARPCPSSGRRREW